VNDDEIRALLKRHGDPELRAALEATLATLTPREQHILSLPYGGQGMTFKAIGQRLKVTGARASAGSIRRSGSCATHRALSCCGPGYGQPPGRRRTAPPPLAINLPPLWPDACGALLARLALASLPGGQGGRHPTPRYNPRGRGL
jgi:Sigma-70, region 4